MPGSVGWQGLVIILIVLLLVFGPKRLPEMGRSLGRGMREFKDSISGIGNDDEEAEPGDRKPLPTNTAPPAETSQPHATQPPSETERVSP